MAAFGFNYALKPPPEALHCGTKVSWEILDHSRFRNFFKAFVLSWADVKVAFSKMD